MSLFSASPIALGREAAGKSWWLYTLLGIALLIGGVIVLGDVAVASVISALFIGWTIVIAGILQIFHALSSRGWKGFLLDFLLGVLYVVGGAILVKNPVAASISLTLALGAVLLVSGLFRIILGATLQREGGWAIIFSGIIAVLAGIVIFAQWPESGLWVLGVCLGVDLIFHGIAWVSYSFQVRSGEPLRP